MRMMEGGFVPAREGRGGAPGGPRTVMATVVRREVLEGGEAAAGGPGTGPELVLLELAAPRLARTARPGQFVRLRHGQQAQSFHVATRGGRTIGLLVRPGWGISTQVAALRPGERLEVTGPLGRAFAPAEGRPVWHLAAPGRLHALLLAGSEQATGSPPGLLSEVGRLEPPPWWPIRGGGDGGAGGEDGSGWLPLRDLDELEGLLAALEAPARPLLRAAGPVPFLARIARVAATLDVPLQVAVESMMACGVGVCLGCVLPRRGGAGASRWLRACTEGPVFDAAELDWDRMAENGEGRGSPVGTTAGSRRSRGEEGPDESPAVKPELPDAPLNVRLGGSWLRNPLMPASGCFGHGREMASFYPLRLLGAVVTKGVSLRPWEGRPTPRVAWAAGGLLNAVGLQNPGVEHFLREALPFLVDHGAAVVVNVVGENPDEYAAVAARLEGAPRFPVPGASDGGAALPAVRPYEPGRGGLLALELNISCPNVDAGGLHFGQDPAAAAEVVRAVRRASSLPLWVKLSPQGPVSEVARAVVAAGARVLSVANTLPALALDPRSGRPRLAAGPGGLSGPPLKPVSLELVRRLRQELKVDIIGIGGIRNLEDVLEYLQAGATAVAVGSAHFTDPYVLLRLRRGLLRAEKARAAAGRTEDGGRCWHGRRG